RLPVCLDCLAGIHLCYTEPACPRCGRAGAAPDLCPHCRTEPPAFDSVASWAWYEGAGRELIRLLKFHAVLPAATFLTAQMDLVPAPSADLVLAVPLGRHRRRERGFNQAEHLARRWARHHGLPASFRALWRTRDTAPQWGLSARERQANMAGAFAANAAAVAGRRILLVDDVLTTGATASACAAALRQAGAAAVYVLTAARAPWRDAAGETIGPGEAAA
ncbi:MAG: ComF family protein, partial [Terriglobales bacterium]